MAGNKAKRATGNWQLAPSKKALTKKALSTQHSAVSQRKTNPKKSKSGLRRLRRNALRFSEVVGKTVAFVEMDWSADFPCVEIGFEDKTALLVLMGTRLTMEPAYSDWKTGNMKELRRWARRETEGG